ncbi:uncharacterized protein LOC128310811 [Anopheles moucheti]|uniref:uncharacterized protein LOC128310811 n=1 Tax=Anopheles moucheti TaxID=186751 RepID=UPI0022F0BDC5|nr:uncharacterized protein LOC128310811 [Anopheles moucheti]XP_052903494.1 uncharacterized protein LOC128310811 [Anopheles moucheti]
MSVEHISRIMDDFLHRGVERNDEELLLFERNEEFFEPNSKTCAVNILAFALGHIPCELTSLRQFEDPNFLSDRKLCESLTTIVNRMPTPEFQLIPLVLLRNDRLEVSFFLRVRKAHRSTECIYLDQTNRKYDVFEQFLTNNKLPSCTMWYPKDGLLRYEKNSSGRPMLAIASSKITSNSNVWQGLTVVGSAVATLLAFTPLSATITVPLMIATSAASSGLTFAELLDSCKHEQGTVVAKRAVALALNLTTFASTGLTVVCRTEKLRQMLPAQKLLQLERAEKFLAGTMRSVATGNVIVAVIGTVNGWQSLSTTEWAELAAILCFAYRQYFNQENALLLLHKLQHAGVYNFFKKLCPNVSLDTLRLRLEGTAFDNFLNLVMRYLKDKENFTVDNKFIKIKLFGYELEFDMMFKIDWQKLKSLLLFLETSKSAITNACSKAKSWTQDELNDAVKLLQMVSKIPKYTCTLSDYITLGSGHRFTMASLHAFLTAQKLERNSLLRQLASMTPEQTEMLNKLRESDRISGGDRELFKWLGNHSSSNYCNALFALISVAQTQQATTSEHSNTIQFTHQRIIVSSLLSFDAEDFLKVPEEARTILLGDERFLRLCYNANQQLLPRANNTWMRTCCSIDAIQHLETVELLRKLFERVNTTSASSPTLASALDYALDFENTTVSQVYYSIVSAWKHFTVPLDKPTLKTRFLSLLTDAIGTAQYYNFPMPEDKHFATNDEEVITFIRAAWLKRTAADMPIPFGPVERAAFWLGLLPALRNETSRKCLYQTFTSLIANGTGTALCLDDPYKRMVKFATAKDMVIVEMIIPTAADTDLRVSLYMCGNNICSIWADL